MSDTPENIHKGVKIAELYAKVWSKWDKILLLIGLILFSWASGFASYMNMTLLTNVTSLFDTTNYISILDTVLSILQAVLYPIFSKLSDMYGRAYLYTAAIVLYMISYVIFACAHNYETLVVSTFNLVSYINKLSNVHLFRVAESFTLLVTPVSIFLLLLPLLILPMSLIVVSFKACTTSLPSSISIPLPRLLMNYGMPVTGVGVTVCFPSLSLSLLYLSSSLSGNCTLK